MSGVTERIKQIANDIANKKLDRFPDMFVLAKGFVKSEVLSYKILKDGTFLVSIRTVSKKWQASVNSEELSLCPEGYEPGTYILIKKSGSDVMLYTEKGRYLEASKVKASGEKLKLFSEGQAWISTLNSEESFERVPDDYTISKFFEDHGKVVG